MTTRDYLARPLCGNLFKTFDFHVNLKVMQLTSLQLQVVFYIFLLNWELVSG